MLVCKSQQVCLCACLSVGMHKSVGACVCARRSHLAVLHRELVQQHAHVVRLPLPVLVAEVLQQADGLVEPVEDAHHPGEREREKEKHREKIGREAEERGRNKRRNKRTEKGRGGKDIRKERRMKVKGQGSLACSDSPGATLEHLR